VVGLVAKRDSSSRCLVVLWWCLSWRSLTILGRLNHPLQKDRYLRFEHLVIAGCVIKSLSVVGDLVVGLLDLVSLVLSVMRYVLTRSGPPIWLPYLIF